MPGNGHPVVIDRVHALQQADRRVQIGNDLDIIQLLDGFARILAFGPAVMEMRCRRDIAMAGEILNELGRRRIVAGSVMGDDNCWMRSRRGGLIDKDTHRAAVDGQRFPAGIGRHLSFSSLIHPRT